MIKEAGIGISFNGKEVLQRYADVVFNHTNLMGVLYIQGITEKQIN
jgi:Phosphoserine phosphatase